MNFRFPVLDAEVHLLHPEACDAAFASGENEPARKALHEHPDFPLLREKLSVEALLDSMGANGITRALIMGVSWRSSRCQHDNNAFIETCVCKYPDRFRGLYIPDLSDPLKAAQDIGQLNTARFIGIKLLPAWQGIHIDDPSLYPLWQVLAQKQLFLMVHTDHPTQTSDGDTPYRLLRFMQNNPEIRVLAPHLGGLLCLYGLMPKIQQAIRNAHFITSVSASMQMVEFAAGVNGNNLLFGTDFPFNHCHDQTTPLKALHNLSLTDDMKQMILYKNAHRLFGHWS